MLTKTQAINRLINRKVKEISYHNKQIGESLLLRIGLLESFEAGYKHGRKEEKVIQERVMHTGMIDE